MFDYTFLDNPGIAWMIKLFVTIIICSSIVGHIQNIAESFAKNKSFKGTSDEIKWMILNILTVLVIFNFTLSQIILFFAKIMWFIYDTVIAPILRFLNFPV